jgi:Fe2+ transport system protein FeoA
MQLNEIKDRGTYVVLKMDETQPCIERLMDMGLLPGETLRVRHEAPLGDPISIEFRDCHISVRLEDAAHLMVKSSQA